MGRADTCLCFPDGGEWLAKKRFLQQPRNEVKETGSHRAPFQFAHVRTLAARGAHCGSTGPLRISDLLLQEVSPFTQASLAKPEWFPFLSLGSTEFLLQGLGWVILQSKGLMLLPIFIPQVLLGASICYAEASFTLAGVCSKVPGPCLPPSPLSNYRSTQWHS